MTGPLLGRVKKVGRNQLEYKVCTKANMQEARIGRHND